MKQNKKIKLIKKFALIGSLLLLSLLPLVFAEECSGQSCPTNMSINVINITEIPVTPRGFSLTGQAIYDIMNSGGAGLGSFLVFLGTALPLLLFGLMIVAMIIVIGYAIAYSIKHSTLTRWHIK
jgi:hypothetical protein